MKAFKASSTNTLVTSRTGSNKKKLQDAGMALWDGRYVEVSLKQQKETTRLVVSLPSFHLG